MRAHPWAFKKYPESRANPWTLEVERWTLGVLVERFYGIPLNPAMAGSIYVFLNAPDGLFSWLVVSAHVVEDFVTQFFPIYSAIMTPEDFAIGAHEDSVRDGSGPLRVQGFDQRVRVGVAENVAVRRAAFGLKRGLQPVEQASAALFEECLHSRRILRIVGADGDQLKVPQAELSCGRDKLRELRDARAAGRRPDVEKPHFLRAIFTQCCDSSCINQLHSNGRFVPFLGFLDTKSLLVIHLVEHPCGFVISTGTGFPPNNASTALRAS